MAAILKINNYDIKNPQAMTWDIMDLDSEDGAGRNQLGEMFRDRVAVKRKLSCRWGPLDDAEMSALLTAMSDTFFTIEYPDAMTGTRETKTFYVGDRSAPMYTYNETTETWLWSGLTANFIEQ